MPQFERIFLAAVSLILAFVVGVALRPSTMSEAALRRAIQEEIQKDVAAAAKGFGECSIGSLSESIKVACSASCHEECQPGSVITINPFVAGIGQTFNMRGCEFWAEPNTSGPSLAFSDLYIHDIGVARTPGR